MRVQAQDLYQRIVRWCGLQKLRPLRQNDFDRRLKDLGIESIKSSVNYYTGIGLNTEDTEDLTLEWQP